MGTTRPIRIVGVGSPHGDDAVGWRLAERLQVRADRPAEVIAVTADRLLDHLHPDYDFVLIDACVAEASPGTIARCVWPDPRMAADRHNSTHGFGVPESLRMAEALGRLAGRVVVFAVVIAKAAPNDSLTAAVAAALPELERLVVEEVRQWREQKKEH